MPFDEFRDRVRDVYRYSNATLQKATLADPYSRETGNILEFQNRKMVKICNDSWARLENKEHASFIKLLMRFGDSSCRSVHDRVYALLGLVQDGEQLRIDYNETVDCLARKVIDMFASKELISAKDTRQHDDVRKETIFRINEHLGINDAKAAWTSKKKAQENFMQAQKQLNEEQHKLITSKEHSKQDMHPPDSGFPLQVSYYMGAAAWCFVVLFCIAMQRVFG